MKSPEGMRTGRAHARCTVAALGYFTPKYIEGLGTFQDGGVRVNCPLRTALRESEVLWPSRKRPDLVVSIGTGYASEGSSVDENSTHAFLKGGFIDRAIRTFLSSPAVDGRRGWKDALDSVPQDVQKNVFRLDRILPGELPELDDINAIDELDQHDYRISEELTKAWFAKALFFELDQEPTFLQNHYECRGSILCCKHDAAGIVKQIAARFPEARFALSRGSSLGDVDGEYGCSKCGYYRKRVSFKVSNLHETVDLGVTGTTGFISIGGFPTTVQCLLENQQADSPFGRSDHSRDRWPPSRGLHFHLCAFQSTLLHEGKGIRIARRSLVDNVTSGLSTAVDSVGSVGNTASAAQTLTDVAGSAASTVASVGEDITSATNKTLVNAVDAALSRTRADYPDFLIVGLWSYCNGSFDGSHTPIVTNCSTPSTTFSFNFSGALGLDSSWVASIFPSALQDAIDYYHKFTNWMVSAWIITVVSTVLVLLAGLTAFGSRWGSLITSFCAVVTTALFPLTESKRRLTH
ncbi:hypothetical protein LV156_008984 [Aspergillus fumigatus]|nr:hypothetical protein LV156_008984 [Aspergillus fumigatus]